MFAENIAIIDFKPWTARIAYGQDAPALARRPKTLREGNAYIVHYHVYAAPAGELEYSPGPVLILGAVDQDLSAQRLGQGQLLRAGAYHVHNCPRQPGDLDGGGVHPTGSSHDQYAFPGTQAAARDERMPGGLVDQCRCGSFVLVEPIGQKEQVSLWHSYVLCQRATHGFSQQCPLIAKVVLPGNAELAYPTMQARVNHHTFADLPTGYIFPEGGDLTRAVCAADVRIFQLNARPTLPNP